VVLGRSIGLTEEQLTHLTDDPLPDGVYADDEAAIVRYAQACHRMEPIPDDIYEALQRHFTNEQIIGLCFIVGLSNLVNRFHATFLTDLDDRTMDALGASSPLPLPPLPKGPAGTATR
jgi:alkylhydroperoxidase family enzyme